MNDTMVTVVVPVYKTEKFLDRCLESIVNQSHQNLEIILVDDGSPDLCPEKCEQWAECDSRIKVIHKMNAGLGMARNTGIENATGKYICFFDSDDYVAVDTIEKAVSLAERDQADIVLFGMTEVGADGNIKAIYCPSTEKCCYVDNEVLDFILPNMIEGSAQKGQHFNLNMSAAACLFSLDLIRRNNWRFVSEREYISEDYYSLLELYQHVRRVSVLKQACYYYCFNQESLTHVFRPDRFERICHCYKAMVQKCERIHYSDKIGRGLAAQYLGNVVGAMKTIVANSDGSFLKKINCLKLMTKDETLRNALRRIDLKEEPIGRKCLFGSIKAKCALLVYVLLKAKLSIHNGE